MTDSASAKIDFIDPPGLSKPPGYTHVVEIRGGRLIYISGQVALDAQGKLLRKCELHAQAGQDFRNLSAPLPAEGYTSRNIVKFTVFIRYVGHLPSLH